MSASPLSRSGTVPLWQQLQQDLAARLGSGEFRDVFPSELALVAEYQVSRHTVRQALRQLRAGGAVTATRGRLSRVSPPSGIKQPVGALYALLAAVRASGLPIRSKVRISDIRADGVVAPRLQLEESTPLFYLDRIRYAGDHPFAMDQIWMPASLAGPLLGVDFTEADFYTELAERTGLRLDSGVEQIYALTPTDIQRRLLEIPPAGGAFAIRRLGRVDGRPAEWRHTLVRGDQFPLPAEFAARTGYRLTGLTGSTGPR